MLFLLENRLSPTPNLPKRTEVKDGKLFLSSGEESGVFDELWAKKRK